MNINQLLCYPPSSQGSFNGYSPSSGHPGSDPDGSQSSHGSPTPGSQDLHYKVINRCSNCRQRGHNRKTCPQPEFQKPPAAPTRPRARGCCGLCGETGHNRTSCRLAPPK